MALDGWLAGWLLGGMAHWAGHIQLKFNNFHGKWLMPIIMVRNETTTITTILSGILGVVDSIGIRTRASSTIAHLQIITIWGHIITFQQMRCGLHGYVYTHLVNSFNPIPKCNDRPAPWTMMMVCGTS